MTQHNQQSHLMTQVSFYVINSCSRFACDGGVFMLTASLCEKALATASNQGKHPLINSVLVLSPSDKLNEVDDVLWTHHSSSFLVHEVMVDDRANTRASSHANKNLLPTPAPILLSDPSMMSGTLESADVVFNLTDDALIDEHGQLTHSSASRIIEIVGADEPAKAKGRVRYQIYKKLGLAIEHINVSGKK